MSDSSEGTTTVKLHGGPWHGKLVAIPKGLDHFHIYEPQNPTELYQEEPNTPVPPVASVRQGTYSRVQHDKLNNFEWDGYR